MPTSLRNNRGFTLVELVFAMVITVVGLLGLAQAMNYAVEMNVRNQQRDEAVQIAEDWMVKLRSAPFANLSTATGYGPKVVPSTLRGGGGSYTVQRTVTPSGDGTFVDAGVNVQWRFKNAVAAHEIHAVISQ